ncbi:uncharacterized protein DNG_06480 [Cephalotrichum gorgonifer]|uniref:Uncharacterized protein n=1 Tax=Cephalotrichum gorgonifer TaxID=2041049 RepID=A0AAE8SXC1_9PEZI|nr:uncharacterized protein DNG_06480 [Cephalotrichum gorgonifer]
MFGFRKTLDIITLFHKANSPASTRVVGLLKQASTAASQAANEGSKAGVRDPFDLNVTEEAPTQDQVETILEYVGTEGIPRVVSGASTVTEALRRFNLDKDSFQRPLVVDWNNGKAVIGDNESEILKLLNLSKK